MRDCQNVIIYLLNAWYKKSYVLNTKGRYAFVIINWKTEEAVYNEKALGIHLGWLFLIKYQSIGIDAS